MNKKLVINVIVTIIVIILVSLFVSAAIIIVDSNSIIVSNKYWTNKDFNIDDYISSIDKDHDGIDDQTDMLESVKEYLKKKPKYKSEYYVGGYPTGEYGVCTDVVAYGMLGAGYDLRELVNKDVLEHPEIYNIENVDKDIDFRRVKNLKPYLDHNAISLTTDIYKIEEWQAGDIIVFSKHIGIISDKRNKNGIPFLIHHANPFQIHYEENVIEYMKDDIIGHYRIS